MTNTNQLAGMRCPKCGSLGPFAIRGQATFRVTDAGAQDYERVTWADDGECVCKRCHCRRCVADFRVEQGDPPPHCITLPLLLMPHQVQALRDIIVHALPEEQRLWEANGRPADHICYAYRTLDYALESAEESKTQDIIALLWGIDDVQTVRPDLDHYQAREVLAQVQARHDANFGVTWDTLESVADDLFPTSEAEG